MPCDDGGADWIGQNADPAPDAPQDLAAAARRIAAAMEDTITETLFMRNSSVPPLQPNGGQWMTAKGSLTFEVGSNPDDLADDQLWVIRIWNYRTDRLWPATEDTKAASLLADALAPYAGLPRASLVAGTGEGGEVGEEPNETEVKASVLQHVGEFPDLPLATLNMRIREGANRTEIRVSDGLALRAGTPLKTHAELRERADLFARCWLSTHGAGNATAALSAGPTATHVLDGSIVEEIAYAWTAPPHADPCFGTHPLAVVVDAESAAIREVRPSPFLAECSGS